MRRRAAWVAALVAASLVAAACSDGESGDGRAEATTPVDRCDWPMGHHGPDRTGAYPCPTGIGVDTAAELREVWFVNTRDVVTGTPAVVGDTVYVGDWSGRFLALDAETGEERWHFDTDPHPLVYSGQIPASAAVADTGGEQLVVFNGGKTVYALRTSDGSLRWSHELGRKGDGGDPTQLEGAPVIADGIVVVGFDVHNAPTGEPAGLRALDLASGEERWTLVTAPEPDPPAGRRPTASGCGDVWGSPSVDLERRLVFAGTGNCNTSPEGWGRFTDAVLAADLDTGELRWVFQPHEPNNDDLDFAGAPNLFTAGGRDLVGLGNKDGVYYALERETGALAWQTRVAEPGIAGPNFSTGGFIGAAAVGDGVVVGGTAVGGDPYLHALDAETGAILWQQPEAGPTYAPTTIANGVAFVGGTDFTLRALDLRSGDVLWSAEMPGAVAGGVAVAGDSLFAVAGLTEPGLRERSETSGVFRFSLDGGEAAAERTTTTTGRRAASLTNAAGSQPCIGAPCAYPFGLKDPPPGAEPRAELLIEPDPLRITITASGLGDPAGWLRPGSAAERGGATAYGLFVSERDDNPNGGYVCVLEPVGGAPPGTLSCTGDTLPAGPRTFNRLTLLAVADTSSVPTPVEGFDRLVTTMSFDPPLTVKE